MTHTSAASSLAPILGPTLRNDHDEVPDNEDYASDNGIDPTDVTDAATFEALSQGINSSPLYSPSQDPAIPAVEPVSPAISNAAGQPLTRY